MSRVKVGLLYALFALAATAINVGTQRLVMALWDSSLALYGAMASGTLAGLVVKYALDRRYIFNYTPSSLRENAGTFFVYTLFSGVTTVVFWGVELAFNRLFRFPAATYVGAAVGLAVGYTLKFLLDRRFVFSPRAVHDHGNTHHREAV